MNIPEAPHDINIKEPEKVISENGPKMAGEVICFCGHQFKHDLDLNMVQWHGFVVPCCPECHTVPRSETRRMDG